jgi:hypothetical protein
MYTTFEADIEDGVLIGAELKKLPRKAHVLITLLNSAQKNVPVFGCAKGLIDVAADFDAPLNDFAEYM